MRKTLVVEDDAITGESLAEVLRARGHESHWAATAEGALAWLAIHQADVLVVDNYMPGIDGLELIRRLRERAATAALPVLLLTAAADLPFAEMCRELEGLRPAAALRKPAELSEILAALDALSGSHQS